MKRSTASLGAFAILVALSLLAVCGIVVHGPPGMVFFMGAAKGDLAPFQGAVDFAARDPGVSLRSTPGYGLASLRDERSNQNVARMDSRIRK
jgi:hypothetical protein